MVSEADLLSGVEMDEPEIDDVLKEVGVGTLSMTSDGVPYGIPLSFGYNGEDSLYFLFVGPSGDLRKETYAEQAERVCFSAYEVEEEGNWQSAIVEGELRRVTQSEWDDAREALADNAYHPNLVADFDIWESPNVWVLEIDEKSGRAAEP